MDFVTPSALAEAVTNPAVRVDGDSDANQTRLSETLNVSINPGEVVLLRWVDNDEQGDDQALAIDDLVVTASVEEQGVESLPHSVVSNQKMLRNGQLIILHNGKEYTVMGQLIK